MDWLADFFAAAGRVLAYPFVKLYEFVVWFFTSEYFFSIIPLLLAAVYPILWGTRLLVDFDAEIYLLFQIIDYDWFFVHLGVDWLLSIEHTFLTAITLGLIQIVFIAVAAVLETLIVYFLFFGVGSFIFALIQLIFWLAVLLVLPAALVVWAVALWRRPYAGLRNFHIVVLVITALSVLVHYVFIFSDFQFGCSCG